MLNRMSEETYNRRMNLKKNKIQLFMVFFSYNIITLLANVNDTFLPHFCIIAPPDLITVMIVMFVSYS